MATLWNAREDEWFGIIALSDAQLAVLLMHVTCHPVDDLDRHVAAAWPSLDDVRSTMPLFWQGAQLARIDGTHAARSIALILEEASRVFEHVVDPALSAAAGSSGAPLASYFRSGQDAYLCEVLRRVPEHSNVWTSLASNAAGAATRGEASKKQRKTKVPKPRFEHEEAAIQALPQVLGDWWDSLGVLVNNAGISPKVDGRKRLVEDIPIEEWRRVLDVNLTGPWRLSAPGPRRASRAAPSRSPRARSRAPSARPSLEVFCATGSSAWPSGWRRPRRI